MMIRIKSKCGNVYTCDHVNALLIYDPEEDLYYVEFFNMCDPEKLNLHRITKGEYERLLNVLGVE